VKGPQSPSSRPGPRRTLIVLGVLALLYGLLAAYDRQQGPTGVWLARAGLAAREVEVEGLRLRYVRSGSGPPVLLLHGIASSIYTWREILPGLAADHDVVALDFPGFGGSQIPATASPEALISSVVGLAARLGLGQPVLVGHSLGGAVSVELASRGTLRPPRLVLIDAGTFALRPADRPWPLRIVGRPWFTAAAAQLPVARLASWTGLQTVFSDGTLVTSEMVDEYAAVARRPGYAEGLSGLLASNWPGLDRLPERLSELRLPVLMIWGRDDRWTPVRHAERHRQALRDATLTVFDGCGHMPQEERPAETLRLIRAFLRKPSVNPPVPGP